MTYNFLELDKKFEETKAWLLKEFQQVRTGLATPTLLDSVKVSSYGTKMPINQVASAVSCISICRNGEETNPQ